MGCFAFHIGAKKDEHKIVRALSLLSSDSALTDHELNRSGSELTELNSQNVSSASTESSSRRNTFSSASQRASNLRVFTYQELRTATKGFGRSGRLGEGGFGCVYKGLIKSLEDPSTRLEVAVKQLGKRGLQGHKEWVTEVRFLGVVEHQNLVKLLGYCADDDERGIQRLLIYEYMPNGSVEDHLSPRAQKVLSWPMRLKIAQDAARGLAYLHEGMDFQIIFRDFKSSNILLDEQWNAKLSDFGLARLGPPEGATHVSTAVVGTMGYAAPEYIRTGRLTSKSDVWSFGVFLYELITGRRPIDKNQPKSDQKLLDWVKPYLSDRKKFEQIIDPRLVGCYSIRSVYKLSVIANRCLMTQYKSRPKMSSILQMIDALVDSPLTEMAPSKTLLSVPIEGEKKDPKEKENGERRKWFGRVWRRKVC